MTLNESGFCHNRLQNCIETLTVLNRSLQIKETTTSTVDKDNSIAVTLHKIGQGHNSLQNYNKALTIFHRSLQILENMTLNPEKYSSIAVTLYEIACCHNRLQNYNEVIVILNRLPRVKQSATVNADKDIEKMLYATGCNYCCLQNFKKVLAYFYRSFQINKKTGDDEAVKIRFDMICCRQRRRQQQF